MRWLLLLVMFSGCSHYEIHVHARADGGWVTLADSTCDCGSETLETGECYSWSDVGAGCRCAYESSCQTAELKLVRDGLVLHQSGSVFAGESTGADLVVDMCGETATISLPLEYPSMPTVYYATRGFSSLVSWETDDRTASVAVSVSGGFAGGTCVFPASMKNSEMPYIGSTDFEARMPTIQSRTSSGGTAHVTPSFYVSVRP